MQDHCSSTKIYQINKHVASCRKYRQLLTLWKSGAVEGCVASGLYCWWQKRALYRAVTATSNIRKKVNAQMHLKLKCIQNSARAEYCYHSCFLLTIQCMHISCRQGLGEERIQMRYATVWLSESAWLDFHIFRKIYKWIVCLYFENILVYMTISKSKTAALSRTLVPSIGRCKKYW